MKNRMMVIACLLAFGQATACSPTIQTVEVTRIIPQTVVATQIVQIAVTNAPRPTDTPVPPTFTPVPTEKPSPTQPLPYNYPKPNPFTPIPTETPEPTHVAIMALQDPAMVVVQYYTLLGQHLFKEAYQLVGSHEHTNSPDEEALMDAQAYQVVEVLKVVRYNDWIKQNHINMPPSSDNVYYVQLYVVGQNMVEMTPVNGIVETYAWTIRENGEVKIEFHGKLPYD